jgi:LysM repeat protein
MTANIAVIHVEHNLVGNKQVEIRIEMAVTRACYAVESCTAITSVIADDSAGFPEEKAALKIYYANSGESLWEIAKGCHTSVEAVMDENGLLSDVLPEDTMLLVPLC